MPATIVLKHRSGTASQWTSANPTLAAGELGFESDTGQFKIGTGSTAWTSLAYAAISTAAGDSRYVLASSKGAANGVASLDSGGKIPSSQLPAAPKLVTVAQVANQAARLALPSDDDAQFVVQTDNSTTYMLAAGADPSVNANWIVMPQPSTAGLQPTSEKGQANGYASLDSSGKLPSSQLTSTIDGGTP